MRKIKIFIAGLAAMAAAATIGGTWAVWTDHLLAKNEYMTAKYSTFLKEDFKSPEGWLPGEEKRKAVWVKNESTIPIIAKITMNQNWIRREDVKALQIPEGGKEPEEVVVAPKGEYLPSVFTAENGIKEYAAILNFNKDAVVILSDSRADAAGPRFDIPEVSTLKEAEGKWLLMSETPDQVGNYTFYYMGMVQPGEDTPILLSSVRMNPKLETTVTGSHTYFVKDEEAQGGYKKITVNTVNSKYGYDSSHYTLNVSMQTVQATSDAVKTIFHGDRVSEYIAGYITGEVDYESETVKTLYFDENNGKMKYVPYMTSVDGVEDGNWFMSFTNMVPGGKYRDKLNIENASSKDFRLFMKISPRTGEQKQSDIQEELLKKIAMKVYYLDQLIYDGDVTGYHYSELSGKEDMQGLVPLGVYKHGRKEQIRVELVLDKNIGLDDDGSYRFADVLTKIDWEFMVQEVTTPPDRPDNPGDSDDPDDPGRPDRPGVNIPDEPVPQTMVEIPNEEVPLTILPDPEVPLTFMIPQTGDEFPVIPLAVTAAVSLMLMIGFGFLGFGKKKEKNK
ncbi:MAG: hypothetical protein HFG75_00315 [Hungatella sp.]|nr:hypothetical protein [Hungatella sp.]